MIHRKNATLAKRDYRIRRYQSMRRKLLAELGPWCEICGSLEKLEFDHPYGREWVARELDRVTRMKRYQEDAAVGNLRVLCAECNKLHPPETPF